MQNNKFGINTGILIIGIVIAALGIFGSIGLNLLVNKPKATIIAARQDIPSNTQLSSLNEQMIVKLEVSTDSQLLQSFVTDQEFNFMVQAGGITRREIKAKQPFLKMDVISSKNEGAKYVPSLGMTDPNLVVVHIPIKDGSPSLAEADYVDIVASIDQINYSAQNSMAPIVSVPQPFESTTGIQYGVTPTYGPPPTATPQPTPTLTPTPAVIPPVAKVIVRGAIVTHVYRDTVGVSSSDGTNQSVVYGDIVGIDVLVPRDSQEVISMAISAGVINASLLSPLADVKSGPTLGMSINDFLDWYYSDRNQLRPQPTAVPEQAQPAAPAPEQPTAVPQPPVNIDSGQPTN